MAKSKFNKETNEGPTVREGVRDLTLREGEVGKLRSFINTASAGASRWGPSLEEEDWHTMCQSMSRWEQLNFWRCTWEDYCIAFLYLKMLDGEVA